MSPLEVDAVEATCATQSQQPVRAERLLEQAVDGYLKQCTRNLASWRVNTELDAVASRLKQYPGVAEFVARLGAVSQ